MNLNYYYVNFNCCKKFRQFIRSQDFIIFKYMNISCPLRGAALLKRAARA